MDEEEDFDFEIPGLDPEEVKKARKFAIKDIQDEFSEDLPMPKRVARGTSKTSKSTRKVEKK